jgi:hypothetical protein
MIEKRIEKKLRLERQILIGGRAIGANYFGFDKPHDVYVVLF